MAAWVETSDRFDCLRPLPNALDCALRKREALGLTTAAQPYMPDSLVTRPTGQAWQETKSGDENEGCLSEALAHIVEGLQGART
jgi:hypothetical protein